MRMSECNRCHALRERLRRQNHKAKTRRREIQKLATAMSATRDLERRKTLVDLGVQTFGSFEKLAQAWMGTIHELIDKKESSPRLLRLFEVLCDLQREQEQLVAGSSNETLSHLIDTRLDQWIEDDPQIVVRAATQLGWTIVPPQSL